MAITNYTPPAERAEDLTLSTGETVRLLSEDGAWAFVCTVDPAKRRGWVPSSMLKRKGGSQHTATRRSLSVGDIYNAFEEDRATTQRITPTPKPPVPTPRSDLELRRQLPVDFIGAPSEEAPPMPGVPPGHDHKAGKKIWLSNSLGDQNDISPYHSNTMETGDEKKENHQLWNIFLMNSQILSKTITRNLPKSLAERELIFRALDCSRSVVHAEEDSVQMF